MRIIPAIIIAVALILAPAIWYFLPLILPIEENYEGSAIDSGARIELEMLRQQMEDVQSRMGELERRVSGIEVRGAAARTPQQGQQDEILNVGPNGLLKSYAQVVLIANRRLVNNGLQVAGPTYLEEKLGRPREILSDKCETMTNETLAAKLVLESVGPIRVRMLRPAVDSLKRVMENVRRTDQDLYDRINTAGSLCVRRIRGTENRLSTHSYGLAVDLNIDGHLDTLGDGRTQLGLTILADFFNNEGWVWGAGFGREDSMHFEVSRRQLDEWLDAGLL